MLRTTNQITKDNFLDIIRLLEQEMNKSDFTFNHIGTLKLDNGIGSTFFEPYNRLFKSISITRINDEVTNVCLIGDFDLLMSDLEEQFDSYREYFSSRDEMYFYFFNENSKPIITVRSSHALTLSDNVKIIEFRW